MEPAEEARILRDLAKAIEEREQIAAWTLQHDCDPITVKHFEWDGASKAYGNEAVRRGLIEQIERQWRSLLIDVQATADDRIREFRIRLGQVRL